MNRTFKTLWNVVRGQYVVVNEKTGDAQSRGSGQLKRNGTSGQGAFKIKLTALAMAIAAGFALPVQAEQFSQTQTITGSHQYSDLVIGAGESSADLGLVYTSEGYKWMTERGLTSLDKNTYYYVVPRGSSWFHTTSAGYYQSQIQIGYTAGDEDGGFVKVFGYSEVGDADKWLTNSADREAASAVITIGQEAEINSETIRVQNNTANVSGTLNVLDLFLVVCD